MKNRSWLKKLICTGMVAGLGFWLINGKTPYPAFSAEEETSGPAASPVESATPAAGNTISPAVIPDATLENEDLEPLEPGLFPPGPPPHEKPAREEAGRRRPAWGGPPEPGGPYGFGPGRRGPGGRGAGGGLRAPFGRGAGGGGGPRAPMMDYLDSPERMARLRTENPQLADLIENSRRVTYQIEHYLAEYDHVQEPAGKEKILQQLQPLLEKEFELELQRQHMEIQMMEARLEQLKTALQRREQNRERFIQYRLDTLLKGLREATPMHLGPEGGMTPPESPPPPEHQ
ncbi:MAG: hypothetical protein ACE15F_00335 [bacterium]